MPDNFYGVLQQKRHGCSITVIGSKMYVIGGSVYQVTKFKMIKENSIERQDLSNPQKKFEQIRVNKASFPSYISLSYYLGDN